MVPNPMILSQFSLYFFKLQLLESSYYMEISASIKKEVWDLTWGFFQCLGLVNDMWEVSACNFIVFVKCVVNLPKLGNKWIKKI